MSRVDVLLQPWIAALGEHPDVVRAGRHVIARWAEPHRRYHDQRHLAEVLQALRALSGPAAVPAPVLLAAYWHDVVYEPAADDNEERSADLAATTLPRLGAARVDVDEVVRLVRLTAGHDPAPGDAAGALLCDADLAVLGASPERYAGYAADVRAEYGHLDDEAFRAGRTAVLRGLADRPRLFTTAPGHSRWDAPARRNLRDELVRLGADRPA